MPLIINVGLSRKSSQNYQSSGVSTNLTAEVDQGLLNEPQQLQRRIDDLYGQAEHAIARQLGERTDRPGGGNGRRAGNGAAMTASQARAIEAIGRRMGVDVADEVRRTFGWMVDDLDIRQASQVIDHLKTLRPAQRNGGGR